jgi:hypothetical protein
MALRNRWLPVRNGLSGNTEFAESDKDQLAKTFDLPFVKGSAGGGAGSGSGKRPSDSFIKSLADSRAGYVRRSVIGEFSITEGERLYAEDLKARLEGSGFTIADIEYYGEGKLNIFSFYEDALGEQDKLAKANGGRGIYGDDGEMRKSINAALSDPGIKKYYESLTPTQQNNFDRFLNRSFVNIVADVKTGNIDAAVAQMKQLTTGIVAMKIFSTNNFSYNLRTDAGQNEFLRNIDKYGDSLALNDYQGTTPIGTDRDGNIIIQRGTEVFAGGRERYEEAGNVFMESLKSRAGLPETAKVRLVFRNENIEGDRNESSARFQFVVEGAGSKNGTYRFESNSDSRKPPIIKKDGNVISAISDSQARKERSQEQGREQTRKEALGRLSEARRYIQAGEIGLASRQIRDMITNGQATDFEVYQAGIDPKSYRIITTAEQESIIKKFGSRQVELVKSWKNLGIPLGETARKVLKQVEPRELRGR